jgi:hypothetical protein
LGESLFDGIDFVFETHLASSEYVIDPIYEGFLEYDRVQAERGSIRNYNILSIKYKSSHGDLKVDISTIKPSISMEMIDTPSNLTIALGATGLNPPFQWSFTYSEASAYDPDEYSIQAFTTSNAYILPDITGTNLVFDITVMDSAGSTSSAGYYSVNAGSPISIDGTFSYTTL